MSSTQPAASQTVSPSSSADPFFTAAPASTGDSNSGGGGLAASSSLYLFTFLATLLLLLAVSCAIVVRSLVIRRRFQRRVQDALAQGLVLPPAPGRQRRRDVGEKPTLWDAWIAPEDGDTPWRDILPVSVRIVSDSLTGAGAPVVSPPARPTFLQAASVGLARAQRWRPQPAYLRWRDWVVGAPPAAPLDLPSDSSYELNSDSDPNANPGAGAQAQAQDALPARLQVSVLIAMPSPYRPRAWDERGPAVKGKARSFRSFEDDDDSSSSHADGEDEIPDVVFGVAEVPWNVRVERSGEELSSPPPPPQQQQLEPGGGGGGS